MSKRSEEKEDLVPEDDQVKRPRDQPTLLEILRDEDASRDEIARAVFRDRLWKPECATNPKRFYKKLFIPEDEDLLPQLMRGLCQFVFFTLLRSVSTRRDKIEKACRRYIQECLDELDRDLFEEETNWIYACEYGGDVSVEEMEKHWKEFVEPFLQPEEIPTLKARLGWAMHLCDAKSDADVIRESFHVDSYRDFVYVFDELELDTDEMTKEELGLYLEQTFYPLCWSEEIKVKVQGFCETLLRTF